MAKFIYGKYRTIENVKYTQTDTTEYIYNYGTWMGVPSYSFNATSGTYTLSGTVSRIDVGNGRGTRYALSSSGFDYDQYNGRTVNVSSSTIYKRTYGKEGGPHSAAALSSTRSVSYTRGTFIEDVIAEEGAYPADSRHTDGYWYVKGALANSAPTIDGYTGSTSIDLGTKSTDFSIEYTITDAEGGALTVDIFEDSTKVKSALAVQAGYKNTYVVNLSNFTLGAHYVKIVPKDADGATSDRTYQFYKSNSAPVISGTDEDLGDKNSPFTKEFTVTDLNGDNVSALVTLNGVEIMNVSNAIGQSHFINITQELLTGLPLGQRNTITVKADDGKGGATYRYYYFTRVNKAPIISGNDRDLGIVATVEEINGSFSATDLEGDDISVKILLNGVEVTDIPSLADNQSIDYTFTKDSFIRLAKGQHTIKIVATDSQGESSERIITFTKQVSKLEFILKVNKTDVLATKILFILNAIIASGDTLDIKATNNYSDENPTWEDITAKSAVKMVHQYVNTTKTAPQGEIAIWVKITKASAETLRSIVFGMSGGYE